MEYGSENSPAQEAASALFAEMQTIGPDQTELAAQRELFTKAVDEVASLYPNPNQRRIVAIAAGICDWTYFGAAGDPLPTGLIKTIDDDTKAVRVVVDRRLIDADDLVRARTIFQEQTKRSLHGQLPSFAGLSEVEPAFNAVVEQTEGYKTVRAMAAAPPEPPQPRPLPPWLRAAREAQIETDVRQRYGIDEGEHIARRSPADIARRRALFHLDDEQFPQITLDDEVSDPIHKLRHYFEPIILKKLREEADDRGMYGTEIKEFYLSEGDKDYMSRVEGDRTLFVESYNFLRDHYKALRQPGTYELDLPFESNYLEDVCNYAFRGKFDAEEPQTYEDVVATAADATFAYGRDVLSSDPLKHTYDEFLLTTHAFMRRADGPAVYRSQFEAQPHARELLEQPLNNFLSEQELREQEAQVIGRVHQYDAAAYSRARLIQTASQLEQLPLQDPRAELVFTFRDPQLGSSDAPFVPGYIVASHDPYTSRWGFMPDPAGDPYAEAAVPIPRAGVESLVDMYKGLGLRKLADTLSSVPDLTVADLERHIHENTRYTIPKKPLYFSDTELYTFSRHVHKGELALQCSGSATFLMRSLERAFGEGCAAVQSGLVLPSNNDELNAAGHMQVSFVHDGRTYMLDGTGYLAAGSRGMVANFANLAQLSNIAPAPHITLPPSPPVPPIAEVTETFQQERMHHATQSFEQKLQLMFDLPDTQALIEHIVVRSEDDPLRRSLAVLRDEHATVGALEQTLSYVTAIAKADEATLRGIHLQHYHQHESLNIAKDALQAALDARNG